MYCRWSKKLIEAGKNRLAGDSTRSATSDEVMKGLRCESRDTKEALADLALESSMLKKTMIADEVSFSRDRSPVGVYAGRRKLINRSSR